MPYQNRYAFYSPTRLVVSQGSRSQIPDRFAEIAAALGEDVDDLSDLEAAETAVDAVEAMNSKLGIPVDLSEAGAEVDGIPRMAEDAMKSINIQLNPRKTSLEDVITLYEESF